MAEEKDVVVPNRIIKGLFTLLMIAGIALYVVWTAVMLIPNGRFFDLGLYSVCVIMIMMGLTGRLLYGYREKTESAA